MHFRSLLFFICAAANPMLAMKRTAESPASGHGKVAPKLQAESPAPKYSRFPPQIQQELIELDNDHIEELAKLANDSDSNSEEIQKLKLTTTHEKLNRLLHRAICRGDYEKMKVLLNCGANPNAQGLNGNLALMHVAMCGHMRIALCDQQAAFKLLLEYGADIHRRLGSPKKHTLRDRIKPLETCVTRFEGRLWHQPLIIYSKFTPHFTERGLKQAQQRTRTRLCCLARACPQLPRDIKGLILLAYDKKICRDAHATPLKIHTKQYDRVPQMPLPVIRALIKHDALELEKTKNALIAHKYNQLRPLMTRAFKIIQKRNNPNQIEQTELNPDLLEHNFGKQIEEVIIADCFDKQGNEQ